MKNQIDKYINYANYFNIVSLIFPWKNFYRLRKKQPLNKVLIDMNINNK